MFWMMAALATAGAEDPPEEIVVWQKPFARFDDQRWLVATEVVAPVPLQVGSRRGSFAVNAWQLEAVVHCNLADERGRLREVDCIVEQASVRAYAPSTRTGTARVRLLEELAQELVGCSLQLQAHASGRVPNVDFDGLDETQRDMRNRANSVRTMLSQISAAFYMELPRGDLDGRSWSAKSEPLLRLASPVLGMASARTRHRVDRVDAYWVMQSSGRSTSTAPLPNPNRGWGCNPVGRLSEAQAETNGAPATTKGIPGMLTLDGVSAPAPHADADRPGSYSTDATSRKCRVGQTEQDDQLEIELSYRLNLDAVTIIDPEAGYPVERVWAVRGHPSASSPGSVTGTQYWSNGRLQALGPDQGVALGASGLVGPPGAGASGPLPAWVPVADGA